MHGLIPYFCQELLDSLVIPLSLFHPGCFGSACPGTNHCPITISSTNCSSLCTANNVIPFSLQQNHCSLQYRLQELHYLFLQQQCWFQQQWKHFHSCQCPQESLLLKHPKQLEQQNHWSYPHVINFSTSTTTTTTNTTTTVIVLKLMTMIFWIHMISLDWSRAM